MLLIRRWVQLSKITCTASSYQIVKMVLHKCLNFKGSWMAMILLQLNMQHHKQNAQRFYLRWDLVCHYESDAVLSRPHIANRNKGFSGSSSRRERDSYAT